MTTYTFGAYTCELFTASGTFTPPAGVTAVDVLIVAGGGSGGAKGRGGGGGGAGGSQWLTAQAVTPGVGVTVTVGAGGAAPGALETTGNDGASSAFGATSSAGGGGGAGGSTVFIGRGGGSGSGGTGSSVGTSNGGGSGTAGQGSAGGTGANSSTTNQRAGGGGGGKGGAGGAASIGNGGLGGVGVDRSAELGTGVGDSGWFASGGGGGKSADTAGGGTVSSGGGGIGGSGLTTRLAGSGMANTGGGGGGSGQNTAAGNGGSGVVIVRYATATTPGDPTSVASPAHTHNSIDLTWAAPAGGGTVTGYEITEDGFTFHDVGNVLLGTLTGLSPATGYAPGVRAYGPGGDSNTVGVFVTTDALDPPGVPTIVSETHDAHSITLTWSPPVTGDPADSYQVRIDGGTPTTATSPHAFTGLASATGYTVEVRAVSDEGDSSWVLLSVTTDEEPAYSLDLEVGGHTFTVEAGTPAELGTILAGLRVGWTARQDDGWPTQHEPVSASFQVIVEEGIDFGDVDLGTPIYLHLVVDGVTLCDFGGTIRDVTGVPHPRGMVYAIAALDYLVDLRAYGIDAESPDEFDPFGDIWDALTDGVVIDGALVGMPSLFDPPSYPYPGILGTWGSPTRTITGNDALELFTGWLGGPGVTGGPTGFRNIIVPNLDGGVLDTDHPYVAVRALVGVGDTVTLDAALVPTDAVAYRRQRLEPNRAEVYDAGVLMSASERAHTGATLTRRLETDEDIPPTSASWIVDNLEDLENQWTTTLRVQAWRDPAVIAGWFTLPEAMRTLVNVTGIDPRHNPSGETTYAGMLGGAVLTMGPDARYWVDFTLRRSVPEGTVLP